MEVIFPSSAGSRRSTKRRSVGSMRQTLGLTSAAGTVGFGLLSLWKSAGHTRLVVAFVCSIFGVSATSATLAARLTDSSTGTSLWLNDTSRHVGRRAAGASAAARGTCGNRSKGLDDDRRNGSPGDRRIGPWSNS